MIRLSGIRLAPDYEDGDIKKKAAKKLKINENIIKSAKLHKLSVDARDKTDVHFTATIDVELNGTSEQNVIVHSRCKTAVIAKNEPYIFKKSSAADKKILVVGAGPAGLFAAYALAKAGLSPVVIERGKKVEERITDVKRFHECGELDTESNIQFGEGGAGTFSDGKLNTGIKDKRIRTVLEIFYTYGAPKEILYLAKPHIGTDILRKTIVNMRNEIIAMGGQFYFSHKLVGINTSGNRICSASVQNNNGETTEFKCDDIILAIGHSARDTFYALRDCGVNMIQKPFAVGVRIEHSQALINHSQYGKFANVGRLNAADYKLAVHLPSGRGVYTFCMCPGGYVVAASSEKNMIAVNGMSNFARDGENANSAVLVGVDTADFGSDDVLAGVEFQRKIERAAYKKAGENYYAPAQTLSSFLYSIDCAEHINPTYRPGVNFCGIDGIFPQFVYDSLKSGILMLEQKLHGFADKHAVITAPETRSSSPVRILRGDNMQADIVGLYPCGEGAGYAGGITSAAVDGMKCAEGIIKKYNECV